MKIEQIYTGCLAQGAYYIECNGEAAMIDPLREVQPYIDMAQRNGARIRYIFETHFHADFVSGHVDLARKTGAQIVYGPDASCGFDCLSAKDGQEFSLGNMTMVVLHTPGHTMESTTFLLRDENGKDMAIFSGDTLFLGDVGRPDLAQKAANMTQEQLAGLLYESLMNKIVPLADDVIVYPAHGAGSACGKNMMKETMDTLGNQKRMNYALNQPSKEAFIAAVLDGLTAPPGYFGFNVMMNKQGCDSMETLLHRGLRAMGAIEFEQAADATGALVLDVRTPDDFAIGLIPRSINIGLKGDFAPWVGTMIVDVNQPLLLVCEPGQERECITRLARVGFDNVLGYLEGGFATWKANDKQVDTVNRISPQQFEAEFKPGESKVIDVRKPSEYSAEHVRDAHSRPLGMINEWFGELNGSEPFYLHCAGGYRSMIAASILKSRGIHDFKEVEGGFNTIAKATAVPRTDYTCQSKVLG